jgi:hypothetical protein
MKLYETSHVAKTPEALPLIVYGVATAVAWITTSRAVFQIASMRATKLLSKTDGLPLRKLSGNAEAKMAHKTIALLEVPNVADLHCFNNVSGSICPDSSHLSIGIHTAG